MVRPCMWKVGQGGSLNDVATASLGILPRQEMEGKRVYVEGGIGREV